MKSVPNYVKPVPIEWLILNDVSHNRITINNITNIFIVFPAVFPCRGRIEAQHAAPLLTWDVQQINSMKSGLNEFSILNGFLLSMELTLLL